MVLYFNTMVASKCCIKFRAKIQNYPILYNFVPCVSKETKKKRVVSAEGEGPATGNLLKMRDPSKSK